MTPAARVAAVIEILTEMQVARDAGTLLGRRAGQWLSAGFQHRRFAVRATGRLLVIFSENPARDCSYWLASCQSQCTKQSAEYGGGTGVDRTADCGTRICFREILHAPPLNTAEKSLVAVYVPQFDTQNVDHIMFEWPKWLMDDAKAGLGDAVARELGALLAEAPTDVRINPLKLPDRRKLRDKLAGRSIKGHPTRLSPLGVRLERRSRFEELPEWKAGLFDVQDEGSQLAAMLCDARPGMQVADICAGAGGKSLVMAANMQNKGRILALDPNVERLEQAGKRLRRAGIHNVERKLVAEKWSNRSWRGKFDRVVIDAPCSGSGTCSAGLMLGGSLRPNG